MDWKLLLSPLRKKYSGVKEFNPITQRHTGAVRDEPRLLSSATQSPSGNIYWTPGKLFQVVFALAAIWRQGDNLMEN